MLRSGVKLIRFLAEHGQGPIHSTKQDPCIALCRVRN